MADPKMQVTRLVGIALIVVGAGLIYWGYQLSDSIGSRVAETISGSMPDEVMIRYIVGSVGVAMGAYLFLKR